MEKRHETVEAIAPQAQASLSSDSLAKFALLTVFAVTVLLIGGMIADRQRVLMAFICGTLFFSVFGGIVILVLSGQLGAMVINYQNQRTMRLHDERQFLLYQQPQVTVVEPLRVEERSVVKGLPNFVPAVPAVAEDVKLSSYGFVVGLFKDGQTNPERVLPEGSKSPGQVQAKKPKPEVVEYLLGLGMIRVDVKSRMMFFNVRDFPTLREAQQAIKHGIPRRNE